MCLCPSDDGSQVDAIPCGNPRLDVVVYDMALGYMLQVALSAVVISIYCSIIFGSVG